MNSQARIETHQALQALEDLDDCARMDVGISATGPYDLLRRYIQQQDRLALSHAAGQDGEQCRAASDRAEVAVDLPKIRRLVGPRPMIYMNSFDGQPPCLTLNNACGVIHDLMDEVERLRALSRGVPEGEPSRLLCWAFDNLNDMPISEEWAAEWCKQAEPLVLSGHPAIAAQRKDT